MSKLTTIMLVLAVGSGAFAAGISDGDFSNAAAELARSKITEDDGTPLAEEVGGRWRPRREAPSNREWALMLLRLMNNVRGPAYATRTDDHWGTDAIDQVIDAGIIEGYPDGTFRGEWAMTRNEFAIAASRMLGNPELGAVGPAGPAGPAGAAGPAGRQGPPGGLTAEQQARFEQLEATVTQQAATIQMLQGVCVELWPQAFGADKEMPPGLAPAPEQPE
jgi:hypothetical protein